MIGGRLGSGGLLSLVRMDSKHAEPSSAPSVRVARPAGPLWQLAPGRDAEGRPLSDFLLLLPELRGAGPFVQERVSVQLRAVFAEFDRQVVFADLNLSMNTLWVTVQGRPGLCLEVANAIRDRLPRVRLISGLLPPPQPRGLVARLNAWVPRFRIRILRPGGRLRGPGQPGSGPR
jgi:hypothetical protein